MKYIRIFASISLLTSLAVILIGCKKDDPEPSLTGQQEATKKLSVSWGSAQVLSAPVSGADGTLENLVLTFSATGDFQPSTFTATGAPELFLTNSSSTWAWESTTSTTKILLLNVFPVEELTVEELTETSVTISFVFDGPTSGRAEGLGEYRVTLARQ